MGVGDNIAAITKLLGFKECDQCHKRRKAINNVDLSGSALEVAKGLMEAIFNPPEDDSGKETVVKQEEGRTDGGEGKGP